LEIADIFSEICNGFSLFHTREEESASFGFQALRSSHGISFLLRLRL
jgi:hypothetical protein